MLEYISQFQSAHPLLSFAVVFVASAAALWGLTTEVED
jgi:hypothetical protein